MIFGYKRLRRNFPARTGNIDEEILFRYGATSFLASREILSAAEYVTRESKWTYLEYSLGDRPGAAKIRCGMAEIPQLSGARFIGAAERYINERLCGSGLSRMGTFNILDVGLQDGTYIDDDWHHDGLTGRENHGHIGDYFSILYLGEESWKPSWGGTFEFGARRLRGDWACDVTPPDDPVFRILPENGTMILAVNNNPRLVHRAPRLVRNKVRKAFIFPMRLEQR